jgi:hypothetical protein
VNNLSAGNDRKKPAALETATPQAKAAKAKALGSLEILKNVVRATYVIKSKFLAACSRKYT